MNPALDVVKMNIVKCKENWQLHDTCLSEVFIVEDYYITLPIYRSRLFYSIIEGEIIVTKLWVQELRSSLLSNGARLYSMHVTMGCVIMSILEIAMQIDIGGPNHRTIKQWCSIAYWFSIEDTEQPELISITIVIVWTLVPCTIKI